MASVLSKFTVAGAVAAVSAASMGNVTATLAAGGSVATDTTLTVDTTMNTVVLTWGNETTTVDLHPLTRRSTTRVVVAPTTTVLNGANTAGGWHGEGGTPTTTPTLLHIAIPEEIEVVRVAFTGATTSGFVTMTRADAAPSATSASDDANGPGKVGGDGDSRLGQGGTPDLDTVDLDVSQAILEQLPNWGKHVVIIWGTVWFVLWVTSSIRKDGVSSTVDKIVQALNPFRLFYRGNAGDPALGNDANQDGRVAQPHTGFRDRETTINIVSAGHHFNFGGASPSAVTDFIRAVLPSGDAASASTEDARELVESLRRSSSLEPALPGPASIPAERPQGQGATAAGGGASTQTFQVVSNSTRTGATPAHDDHADITAPEAPFVNDVNPAETAPTASTTTTDSAAPAAGDGAAI